MACLLKAPTREIQDTEWGQTTTPGASSPTLSDKCVGSFNVPCQPCNTEENMFLNFVKTRLKTIPKATGNEYIQ